MKETITSIIKSSIETKTAILNDNKIISDIETIAIRMSEAISCGGKIVICGNGGSASDAMHFAGEIVGRFQMERNPWPAIALNGDVTSVTSIANDYGYEEVFARQTMAHLKKEDVFVGISTSGNSENVFRAMKVANKIGSYNVALLGKDGGKIKDICPNSIIVPSTSPARIQESHIMIIHILCEIIEKELSYAQ